MSRPHILDALRDRVLLADGGMGSHIQASDLSIEKDFMGQENCSEILTQSRPDFIRDFHAGFFAAPCSFNAAAWSPAGRTRC